MPKPTHAIGAEIKLQFIWKLEDGSYLRTIFNAAITGLDRVQERYIVNLTALIAKKEEAPDGQVKPIENWSGEYWQLVENLIGKGAAVAYESADGRPLLLRLTTLTLEHHFFTRFPATS